MKLPRIAAIVAAWAMLSGQSYDTADLDTAFGKDSLVISADAFACWSFEVYVASTRPQQTRGLMFVRRMPAMTGMIFAYRQPGIRSMWMKNTFIPLDMLFIRGDGAVSSVAADTTPHSLQSVASEEPVNFVLELNAGTTARLHIGRASTVIFTNVE